MKIVELTQAETRAAADGIIDVIREVLVPEQPQVVLLVLAELYARLTACHAPHVRPEMRAEFNRLVDRMVPILIDSMIQQGNATEAWREPTKQ